MKYAMMSSPVSDVYQTILRREGRKKIIVSTANEMSDEQMEELYWIVLAMSNTGKRLKDLIKMGEQEGT